MRNIQATQQPFDNIEEPGIVVFGADVIADDWIEMTQEAQLKLLADRLKSAGKGILLSHDSEAQTAAMPPAFPRNLRDNRDRVVHVVRNASAKAAANAQKSEKRE